MRAKKEDHFAKPLIRRLDRVCPIVPVAAAQAEPIPTTNPHAQASKTTLIGKAHTPLKLLIQ